MRTVDPEVWSRKVKRPSIQVTRPLRFGQQARCGLETRLRDSLRDAVAEFWQQCSLPATKYYHIDHMIKYERYRHIAVLFLTLGLGSFLVFYTSSEIHQRPPLIVSQQSSDSSITTFKFPAVALCSNSIISNHPKNKAFGFRESEIEQNLINLGALLTLALPSLKVDFENFVREVRPIDFNITHIMFKLAANCSKILQRCSWRGRVEDCDSMFASRLTALGYCCVFNSRYQPADLDREPAMLDLIGQDYGLGVVVKEELDDAAYMRRPAFGMEMLIFAGHEFPLLESGDVRMYPIPRNASLYFNIRAFLQYPADEIRYFSEERRGCRMRGGGMSWCLAQCRRDTALALCGCVPYALQPQAAAPAAPAAPTCTLSDLACLNKHREKFMYVYPGEGAHPSLSQELQDALDCPQCRVLCHRQQYDAKISYSYYSSKSHVFRNFLSVILLWDNYLPSGVFKQLFGIKLVTPAWDTTPRAASEGLSLTNVTVIRMYYNIDREGWYRLEANTRWYEILAKLCTQWILVTGMTALTYSELIYHCTFRWVHHFLRRTRIANMQLVATSR